MIEIGKKQTLYVDSEDNSGFYLQCESKKEVFMPGTLAPKGLKAGDDVEVFVFTDSLGDQIATGTMPLAEVGEFACLKVKEKTPQGAYLDIGLPKDLLVPRRMQKYEMNVGEIHLVKVMLEEGSNRLYGTEKIGPHVITEKIKFQSKEQIKIIPFHKTPLGFKVLIEQQYLGMVYHNQIFMDVVLGKEYTGSVKSVRADGLIDALLQKVGKKAAESNSEMVLEFIKNNNGVVYLTDKSSPDEIQRLLSISKKSFKSAVGVLYKQRLIKINDDSIELV